MMLAKDIMTKDVVTVRARTPVRNLAKLLSENGVSGVPVLDRDGKVIGIVSEADIVGRKGKQVRSIMSRSVVEVMEDAAVEQIASLMMAHNVKRIPVMRGKRLAGIVSRADIVKAIAMGNHFATQTPIYDL